MVLFAIAQLLLLLLQPLPALAAIPCPPGMAPIAGGSYRIGAEAQLPEEQPARSLRISPFCLDRTELTNDRFAAFVAATGYVTVAERPLSVEQFPQLKSSERAPGSLVFQPVSGSRPIEELSWWHWVPGADWRHPEGPGSDLTGRGPVGIRRPGGPQGSRFRLGQHLEPSQGQHLAGPVSNQQHRRGWLCRNGARWFISS